MLRSAFAQRRRPDFGLAARFAVPGPGQPRPQQPLCVWRPLGLPPAAFPPQTSRHPEPPSRLPPKPWWRRPPCSWRSPGHRRPISSAPSPGLASAPRRWPDSANFAGLPVLGPEPRWPPRPLCAWRPRRRWPASFQPLAWRHPRKPVWPWPPPLGKLARLPPKPRWQGLLGSWRSPRQRRPLY